MDSGHSHCLCCGVRPIELDVGHATNALRFRAERHNLRRRHQDLLHFERVCIVQNMNMHRKLGALAPLVLRLSTFQITVLIPIVADNPEI